MSTTIQSNSDDSNVIFNRIDLDQGNYTIVHNQIINDNELSMSARFLLIYLISKPKSWTIYIKSLAGIFSKNKDTIAKFLKELETHDYLFKTKDRKNGKFSGFTYSISSQKIKSLTNQNPYKPEPVKPDPTKPELINKVAYKEQTIKKERYIKKTETEQKKPACSDEKTIKENKKQLPELTVEQSEIFELLLSTCKKYDFPEHITPTTARELSQKYTMDHVRDKVFILGKKINSDEPMLNPAGFLINAIKGNYQNNKQKQEHQPPVNVKKPGPDHSMIYKYFSDKKVIAFNQVDPNFEICKWLLRDFYYLRQKGKQQNLSESDQAIINDEKKQLKIELAEMKQQDQNNLIDSIINEFSYPGNFAGSANKAEFLKIYGQL